MNIFEEIKQQILSDDNYILDSEDKVENLNNVIKSKIFEYEGRELPNLNDSPVTTKQVKIEILPGDSDFSLLKRQIKGVETRKDFIRWIF